jgi:hypothetical protein
MLSEFMQCQLIGSVVMEEVFEMNWHGRGLSLMMTWCVIETSSGLRKFKKKRFLAIILAYHLLSSQWTKESSRSLSILFQLGGLRLSTNSEKKDKKNNGEES